MKFNAVAIVCRRLPNKRHSSGELRFHQIIEFFKSRARSLCLYHEHDVNKELFQDTELKPVTSIRKDAPQFDIALLEFWYMHRYASFFQQAGVPVVIDSVDVEFVRREREARVRGVQRKDFLQNKERELAAYRDADQIWVVTKEDAMAIEGVTSAISIIPNIHPLLSSPLPEGVREGVCFVGSFKHKPNVDGMRWYMREVLPLLSDVPHLIIGNDAPKDIREMKGFVGGVKDSRAYVSQARVSIAPLRYGAGMKGKIGEAFSCGTPVVTTSIGAEGYPVTHGKNMFIADTPEEFASGIKTLLANDEIWRQFAVGGKEIASQYTPSRVYQLIEDSIVPLQRHRVMEESIKYTIE